MSRRRWKEGEKGGDEGDLKEEDVAGQSLHGENQEVHQISALHISVISRLLEGLIRNASEGNEKEEEEGE